MWRDICTSVFITALLTIAKLWKHPKDPLSDEWTKKLVYINIRMHIHAIEDCCVVLSRSVMSNSFATTWTVAHQAPLPMGILQARILEWVAIPSSKGSSWPRDQTSISCIAGRFSTTRSPRKPREYYSKWNNSNRERQIYCTLSLICGNKKYNKLMYITKQGSNPVSRTAHCLSLQRSPWL